MSTTCPDYELRAATADDAAFLLELFAATHAAELAPLGLPPAALAGLLAMQARGQAMSYAAQFPGAQDQVVRVQGSRAGRLLVARVPNQLHLVDIALLPAFQQRGIGGSLLGALCREAAMTGWSLTLRVRENNPARHLYQRAGFVEQSSDGMDIQMIFSPI